MKKALIFAYLFAVVCLASSQNQQNGSTYYSVPSGFNTSKGLVIDATQNVWVFSTNTSGVASFNGSNWTIYNSMNVDPNFKYFRCITKNMNGNIIAANSQGLYTFANGVWASFNSSNSNMPNCVINSIACRGGEIWMATNKGVVKFDGAGFTTFDTSNTSLNVLNSEHIYAGKSGNIYAAFKGEIYQFINNDFVFVTKDPGTGNSVAARAICEGLNNDLWFSTNTGIYNFKSGIQKTFDSIYTITGMESSYCNSIIEDAQSNLIFTTGTGILKLAKDTLYQYFTAQFLYGNIYATINPANNDIWLFQGNGQLIKFDTIGYNAFNLGIQYGINRDNSTYLNLNNLSTLITNKGVDHLLPAYNKSQFFAPKGSNKTAMAFDAFSFSGKDENDMVYGIPGYMLGDRDMRMYYPGPLDTVYAYTDPYFARKYDRVWKITREQIEQFKFYFSKGNVQDGTFKPAEAIVNWPGNGAVAYGFSKKTADYVDADSNGYYNPLNGGDYPKIYGDLCIFSIYNDKIVEPDFPGSPMKLEIHQYAYQYSCDNVADSEQVLNNSIFYKVKVFNRSTHDYHDMTMGILNYPQLAMAFNTAWACNPKENYTYAFLKDSADIYGLFGVISYKNMHPVVSHVFLNGPDADVYDGLDNDNDGVTDESNEKCLVTGHMPIYNEMQYYSLATNQLDVYNLHHSVWPNGSHLCYGHVFPGGNIPVNMLYTALPSDTDNWNPGTGPAMESDLISSGHFSCKQGASVEFDYSIVFTSDSTLPYKNGNIFYPDVFTRNRDDNRIIRKWFNNNSFPSCKTYNFPLIPNEKNVFELFPNPAMDYINLLTNTNFLNTEYVIYDMTGRLIDRKIITSGTTQIDLNSFAKGVYILTIPQINGLVPKRFVKQ